MPFFICLGMLFGVVVAAFWLGPLVLLWSTVGRILRRQARPGALVLPLVWLSVGALVFIGAMAVDAEGVGRAARPALILAFLGLPGDYVITWEPGLWIVRAIVLALVLLFVLPLWRGRQGGAARRIDPLRRSRRNTGDPARPG